MTFQKTATVYAEGVIICQKNIGIKL